MDVTRYIIENKVTGQTQNVSEDELATIQGNPRVSSMWFVKEKLPGAITKNIPPANVKVNGDGEVKNLVEGGLTASTSDIKIKPVKKAEKK